MPEPTRISQFLATTESRKSVIWPGLLVILLTFGVHFSSVWNDFVSFDDTTLFLNNPHLNPPTWAGFLYYWKHPFFNIYSPVTCSVWVAISRIAIWISPDASIDPHVMHLAQVLFHVVATGAVYAIVSLLIPKRWPAVIGALWFGLHPVQVESVAWLGAINVPLSAAFGLTAVAIHVHQSDKPWYSGLRLLSLVLMLLGVLARPSVVTLPIVAALLLLASGKSLRHAIRTSVPLFLLIIPCLIWTMAFQRGVAASQTEIPIWNRPWIAGHAMGFYLVKSIVPYPLAVDYGYHPAWLAAHLPICIMASVGVVALLISAGWFGREKIILPIGLTIFCLTVLPSSGLMPFDFQRLSNVTDRYAYLPMLGAAIVIAWALARMATTSIAIVVCVLVVFIGLTELQITYWRNSVVLYEHTLAVNPQSWIASTELANVLAPTNPDRAIALYRNAAAIDPSNPSPRVGIAALLVDQNPQAAISICRSILAEIPDMASAWATLGSALYRTGDHAAAFDAISRTYQLSPNDPAMIESYAFELVDSGKLDEAERLYLSISTRNPQAAAEGLKKVETARRGRAAIPNP